MIYISSYEFWKQYIKDITKQLEKLLKSKKEYILADLHIHSNYSCDGMQTLKQILMFASEKKLDVISITDHDSISVYNELPKEIEILKKKGYKLPIIIPGVEFSVRFDEYGSMCHILKYFINPFDPIIIEEINRNYKAYWNRAEIQIDRLKYNKAVMSYFRPNSIKVSINDFKEFLYNNYKIPIPEYNSIAEYIFSKLNSVGVNVSDVLEKSILINNEDKCIVRRDLKKLAFNRFINKYKGCNINNSKYLLPILSVPNIDDEEFINFDSSGNLSVNNYGQIRFEDLNRKYITVFAHPNENKLEILSKYFYQNQIVDGIEINKRNRHCEKDKILKFVRSHNIFYTIGSDDHGDHLYTYEDINYYKLNSIEFKKILKLVMRREEL
ncbi:TPA: PHP domain-containing protein [Clostridium perfringens]|nr:PHP domain-containing protein [Clostridium perfringens]